MKLMNFDKIAMPTSVKGITKYKNNGGNIFNRYKLGTPVHVKSSLFYNDLLEYYKITNKYPPIYNGEKIKWVYLKNNPLGLQTVAYKGYADPPQILDFIKENIDPNKIYKQMLYKKIMVLYESMSWDEPTDASKTIEKFF